MLMEESESIKAEHGHTGYLREHRSVWIRQLLAHCFFSCPPPMATLLLRPSDVSTLHFKPMAASLRAWVYRLKITGFTLLH